jgi:tryptophan-rich sensory protein
VRQSGRGHAAWSPLFFGKRRASAALLELGLLWTTLAAYARQAGHVDRRAEQLVLPYLAWLTFAGVLNGSVVKRNPRWLHG